MKKKIEMWFVMPYSTDVIIESANMVIFVGKASRLFCHKSEGKKSEDKMIKYIENYPWYNIVIIKMCLTWDIFHS